jgi:hypothetical protein
MSELRGWHLPEQHLHPDALVAFVDGELSESATIRAAAHIRTCLSCQADACAQRQARGAVRSAEVPPASAGLLASLRAIPTDVDLPSGPDGLAMTEDGELVSVQRQHKHQEETQPLGSSKPLGNGSAVLNTRGFGVRGRFGRRGAQGAGVVVSGLVLGALALASPFSAGERVADTDANRRMPAPTQAARDLPVNPVKTQLLRGERTVGERTAEGVQADPVRATPRAN